MRSERPGAGLTHSRFPSVLGENSESVPKVVVALHSSLAALPSSPSKLPVKIGPYNVI